MPMTVQEANLVLVDYISHIDERIAKHERCICTLDLELYQIAKDVLAGRIESIDKGLEIGLRSIQQYTGDLDMWCPEKVYRTVEAARVVLK